MDSQVGKDLFARRMARKVYGIVRRFRPLRTVPLEHLRCQKLSYSEVQGFSGRPIQYFPPASFFELYLNDHKKGHDAFCDWYREWFDRKQAWKVSKKEGGMKGGSLENTLRGLYRMERGSEMNTPEDADPALIDRAIEIRIQHYFDLLESIRTKGYMNAIRPPISAYFESGLYYLSNGHHRAAALWALKQPTLKVQII